MAAGLNVALPRMLASRGGVAPVSMLDLDFTSPGIVAALGSAIVCNRATPPFAYADDASGVWIPFAPNTPRITTKGLLVETSKTNLLKNNRNLTGGTWTKTNVTAVQDQVGIDGVANSACRLTATANGATITGGGIVSAANAKLASAWVKRLTGAGTIEMTVDSGTTWSFITITSLWTRVQCPIQSVGNHADGFRFGTSGDSIAVDFIQEENTSGNATNPSSPIDTSGGAGVARAEDDVTIDLASFGFGTFGPIGSIVVQFIPILPINASPLQVISSVSDGTITNRAQMYRQVTTAIPVGLITIGGTNAMANTVFGTAMADGVRTKIGMSFSPGSQIATKDGGAGATNNAGGVMPNLTTLMLGNVPPALSNPACIYVERVQLWDTQKTLAELQALTA